jgi:hypothetical protein
VATVQIFRQEFEQLVPGDTIAVYSLPSETASYITASKLEESKPFIHMGALTVTWHFPVAVVGWIVMGIYVLGAYLKARRKRSEM